MAEWPRFRTWSPCRGGARSRPARPDRGWRARPRPGRVARHRALLFFLSALRAPSCPAPPGRGGSAGAGGHDGAPCPRPEGSAGRRAALGAAAGRRGPVRLSVRRRGDSPALAPIPPGDIAALPGRSCASAGEEGEKSVCLAFVRAVKRIIMLCEGFCLCVILMEAR